MKNNNAYKKITLWGLLTLGMSLFLLTGCGRITEFLHQKDAVLEEVTEPEEPEQTPEPTASAEPEEVLPEETIDYGALYARAIREEFTDRASMFLYKLIYINDDDIPELYYYGDCEATGSGVLYIDPQGTVQLVMMNRLAGAYEPRGNFYYHRQGHMGYYFDEFYGFVDGEFVYLEGGYYTDIYDETAINEEGELGDFVFDEVVYNDREVTYEEYCELVDQQLKGHSMVDLCEWFFTKDGKPVSEDEYWEHWGDPGYEGGPDLLYYDEIMKELTGKGSSESKTEFEDQVLTESGKIGTYDYVISEDIILDDRIPDAEADLFTDFLKGKCSAKFGNRDITIADMIDDEIDRYIEYLTDVDSFLTQVNENPDYWEEHLDVNYTILGDGRNFVLFVDVMVLDSANGHSFYRLSADGRNLSVRDKTDLSWCDWAVYYEGGILEICHGQHLPAVNVYYDAIECEEFFFVQRDMVREEKALLVVVGPKSWVTGQKYEGCALKTIIWDEGNEDVSDQINEYFGFDLGKREVQPVSLVGRH